MSETKTPLYLCDREINLEHFESAREKVRLVCLGDSITGWNNHGAPDSWQFKTYPLFLQEMLKDSGILIANCGIAGEISCNGLELAKRCLNYFPNSRYFVIGFGTNDLALGELAQTSQNIIRNISGIVYEVQSQGRVPLILNIPYLSEQFFSGDIAQDANDKRDYHNLRLNKHFKDRRARVIDICSKLSGDDFADGLHPNSNGARKIAQEVFKENFFLNI